MARNHKSSFINHKSRRLKTVLMFATTLTVLIGIFLRITVPASQAAWFDDSYAYRVKISFTHNADITSPRAVTYTLDTAELISAGLMQSDCDDIRFADASGKSLAYDLTGTCNNASTTFEIIYSTIINGTNISYAYYGNASAFNNEIDSTSYTALTPSGGDPSAQTDPSTNQEQGPTPISYWSLDENNGSTANDGSSQNNDLVITNAIWKSSDQCMAGNCLYFDGNADRATKTYSSDLELLPSTTSFSISAWLKHSSTAGADTAISRVDSVAGVGWKIYMDSSGYICFGIDGAAGSFPSDSACTTSSYADSKWHHIVGVKSGTSSITLYIDGSQIAQDVSITASSLSGTNAPFTVGNDFDNGTNGWDGFIDEVKYYNFAKSAAQIKTDFASKGIGSASATIGAGDSNASLSNGLVGHWKMDDNTGTAPIDSSGNAYTATATNTSWTNGKFGSSLNFNGTTSYNQLPDNADLQMSDTENFTFATWVKVDTVNIRQPIIIYDDCDNADGDANCGASRVTYTFRIYEDNALEFYYGPANNSGYAYGNVAIATGTWYHLAAVKTVGKPPQIYVNGVDVTATGPGANYDSPATGWSTTGQYPMMGRYDPGASPRYLDGVLDDFRIYNRALSPAEINTLYNWAPSPLFNVKFDENTGTSLSTTGPIGDSSTFFDAADVAWTPGKFGSGLRYLKNTTNTSSGIDFSSAETYIPSTSRDFTMEMYVKVNDVTGQSYWFDQPIMNRTVNTNSGGCTTQFGLNINARSATDIYLYGSVAYQNAGSACNERELVNYGNSVANLGQWYHTALTYNGTSKLIQFYIDGKLIESTTWGGSGDWTFADSVLELGTSGLTDNSVDFVMDEAKIYDYVRTPKQIIEDMNGGHAAGGSPIASQTIYWAMDEANGTTLNNSNPTQSALTGAVTTGTWLAPSSCKINTCESFTAQASTISAGDTAFTDSLTGFTSSLWLNPQSLTVDDSIVSKSTLATNNSFLIRTDSSTASEIRVYVSSSTSDTSNYFLTSGLGLTASTWQNLTVVYDGTQAAANRIRVYKNGKPVNGSVTGTIPTALTTGSTSNLKLGDSDITGSDGLVGYYDEFKFYAYPLSPSEIQVDANAGAAIALGGVLGTQNDEGFSMPAPGAWWKFDDRTGTSAKDSSGNSLTGTLTSGPTWENGKIGSSIYLTGTSSQFVEISDNAALKPTTAISVSTWFKATNINGATRILSKKNSSGYRLALNTSTCTGETSHLCFLLRISGADQWSAYAVSNLSSNTWYHTVGTYDGTTIKLYVNGNLVDTTAASGTIDQGTPNLCIGVEAGAGACSTNNAFTGWIDDTRIYSSALTQAQVAYLYNRGAPVAYYQFDECQGSSVKDASGNGYNGTLTVGGTGTQTTGAGDCSTNAATPWYTGRTGKYNSSLNFDGTDDYVQITGLMGTPTTISLSGWVNFTTRDTNDSELISLGDIVAIRLDEGSTGVVGFYHYAGNWSAIVSTKTILNTGWHHIAYIVDPGNSSQKLYIDGQLYASDTRSSAIDWTGQGSNTQIGRHGNGSTAHDMGGLVDEIKIYNYGLSASQVLKDYNQGAAQRFGPIVGSP